MISGECSSECVLSHLAQGVSDTTLGANLLVQYLPSIVITLANFIAPLIFSFLITLEEYSPAFEIRLTLLR